MLSSKSNKQAHFKHIDTSSINFEELITIIENNSNLNNSNSNQRFPEQVITCTRISFVKIFNSKFPFSCRILAPVKQSCDGPVCQTSLSHETVHFAVARQWRCGAAWCLQLQGQVSTVIEVKIYFDLYVLQEFNSAAFYFN